jgi:hypothetical protein
MQGRVALKDTLMSNIFKGPGSYRSQLVASEPPSFRFTPCWLWTPAMSKRICSLSVCCVTLSDTSSVE